MNTVLPTIFSCGSVVYRRTTSGTEILLVKQFKQDSGWGIPKGRMEANETYVDTAIRETKEETGIDIKIITQLPHVIIVRNNYKKIVIPFLAIQTCDNDPRSDNLASEVYDVKWFDTMSMPNIYYYQRPILDAALMLIEMRPGWKRKN